MRHFTENGMFKLHSRLKGTRENPHNCLVYEDALSLKLKLEISEVHKPRGAQIRAGINGIEEEILFFYLGRGGWRRKQAIDSTIYRSKKSDALLLIMKAKHFKKP